MDERTKYMTLIADGIAEALADIEVGLLDIKQALVYDSPKAKVEEMVDELLERL